MWDIKDPVKKKTKTATFLHFYRAGYQLPGYWCPCFLINTTKRTWPVDGILCHQDRILIPWPPFSLWPHKNTWVNSDKGVFHKTKDIIPIKSHFTGLTFFLLRKITLTLSVDTTMLTFFFFIFFSLNSYCKGKMMFKLTFKVGPRSNPKVDSNKIDNCALWCD